MWVVLGSLVLVAGEPRGFAERIELALILFVDDGVTKKCGLEETVLLEFRNPVETFKVKNEAFCELCETALFDSSIVVELDGRGIVLGVKELTLAKGGVINEDIWVVPVEDEIYGIECRLEDAW